MRTVAFVPVKLKNERLPGKNIKRFSDGTPLISVLLDKLSALKGTEIDEIYVYCSDERIIGYLPEGVRFLKRPVFLDEKSVKGRMIYEEFVKTIKADIYVLAHVTTPFVTKEHIMTCIEKVKSGMYDSAFCAKKLQTFLWQDGKPYNFDLQNPPRTQDMKPFYVEIPTPYVFTLNSFRQNHARTGYNPYICECTEPESVDIDYADDFELADAVYCRMTAGDSGKEA